MKPHRLAMIAFLMLICISFTSAATAGIEPSPFRPEINKLNAVSHQLASIHDRIIKVLSCPPGKRSRCSKINGAVNRLSAVEKQLIRKGVRITSVFENILSTPSDDIHPDTLLVLSEIRDAAHGISDSIDAYFATPPDNTTPVEFIDMLGAIQSAAQDIAKICTYYIDIIGGGTQSFTLSIAMGGTGSGRVTSLPAGIFCETDCLEDYDITTQVTLTAEPYSGSIFSGWSGGGCSGTGTCNLPMEGDTSVTALFTLSSTDLSNLITPYVNESDMLEIRDLFNSQYGLPPLNRLHDGLDIYPIGDLKPFQALCSGRIKDIAVNDEQVMVWLDCNSTYTAEYIFESQAPQTGQIQLSNILVVKGQLISQGDLIGYLYAPNEKAHVHFSFFKDWIPVCPEPYLDLTAQISILNLINVVFPGADMCYGGDPRGTPLVTPYVNESDMTEINPGFSNAYTTSPWGGVHEGLDIYPQANLKPFQASCSGVVDTVELQYDAIDSNYQVEVSIFCDKYVVDPLDEGYFIPHSIEYVFEPMSANQADGQTQLNNIMVVEGQSVSQRDVIGYLYAPNTNSHMHFEVLQYGRPIFAQYGVTGIPICPEPHFSTTDKDSILNLLHAVWPSANMCYQE